MSEELAKSGIQVKQGYEPDRLNPRPDLVIVGNALSRGNESVEYVLAEKIPYMSGPQWLAGKCVAGTHGNRRLRHPWQNHHIKHTCLAVAWRGTGPRVFDRRGSGKFRVLRNNRRFRNCSWLKPMNMTRLFSISGRSLSHYRPDVLIINNIEYDHADIFADVAAVQRQFHHLVRTVPGNGRIIARAASPHIDTLLEMGCWSPVDRFGDVSGAWRTVPLKPELFGVPGNQTRTGSGEGALVVIWRA